MKAILQDQYGSPDVLQLRDIGMPAVKDRDVLVRVQAAALHAGDVLLMRGQPYLVRLAFGLRVPRKKIPGFDVAGRVEAIGQKVTGFRPGDEVYGQCNGSCAEFVSVSEDALALKPSNLSIEQAAAVSMSGMTALHAFRGKAELRPGSKVLINGASGGVGTYAVQIAKSLGAEVTGVCSTRNVELVRSLCADHVIDYNQEDFTRSANRYDVVLDNVGNHSMSECRRVLTSNGTLIPNNGTSGGRWVGTMGRIARALLLAPFVSQRLRLFVSVPKREDYTTLQELIESGKVRPVIDRTYPLSEVPEAMRYLEAGHASGKVVITF